MELPGKRKREKPMRRFLDIVKEHMKEVGAKEIDVRNRAPRKSIIRYGYPVLKRKAEKEDNQTKKCLYFLYLSATIKLLIYTNYLSDFFYSEKEQFVCNNC